MTGHANRNLHRKQHTLLQGICRPLLKMAGTATLALEALLRYSMPVNGEGHVMDTRTVLILGLGIVILLLLGFCALPM
ncbi:hypothetical protein AJ88_26625 [Mesorhizobium amorphae CCBAU 01583]|nr:hypothetical protein AJ88_26625 [Mesorhizobium amorphae CCBAU 01583]